MTYRNKTYEVGDLVEAVWVDSNMMPVLTGIVVDLPEAWKGKKANVLWNEIGIRLEWISDIKVINEY